MAGCHETCDEHNEGEYRNQDEFPVNDSTRDYLVGAPGLEPGRRPCIRRLLYQLSYAPEEFRQDPQSHLYPTHDCNISHDNITSAMPETTFVA